MLQNSGQAGMQPKYYFPDLRSPSLRQDPPLVFVDRWSFDHAPDNPRKAIISRAEEQAKSDLSGFRINKRHFKQGPENRERRIEDVKCKGKHEEHKKSACYPSFPWHRLKIVASHTFGFHREPAPMPGNAIAFAAIRRIGNGHYARNSGFIICFIDRIRDTRSSTDNPVSNRV